jgi:hypothetical protein
MKNSGSPGKYIGKSRIEQLNSGRFLVENPLNPGGGLKFFLATGDTESTEIKKSRRKNDIKGFICFDNAGVFGGGFSFSRGR